jgi:hypothetical protein
MPRLFRAAFALALPALSVPTLLLAQLSGISAAFELERKGNYAAAAAAYRDILKTKPAELAALLGLERSLVPLNRSADIVPDVRAALATTPRSGAIYGIALRAWAAAEQPDSMRAVAERWSRVAPDDEAPYREWGAAALQQGDRVSAREAYRLGRQRLGRPDALAAEQAQLAASDGDFPAALREWLPAIRRMPGYRVTAVSTLALAPAHIRPALLEALAREHDFAARRLEAELRVRWGDPLGGLTALESALPSSQAAAVDALRGLLDQLRGQRDRDGLAAQARALEAIALRSGEPQASRVRLEAARVYSSAGDPTSARRMLAALPPDADAADGLGPGAATTLVGVLVGDGKLEEASSRLEELRRNISSDEYRDLRRRIAAGWIRAGDLGRADSMLGADSSIDGLALRGRIQLYAGDIAGAVGSFTAAGPYAGERAEATRRTQLLALLQPIEADTLPALGEALWRLERGDTSAAAKGMEELAATLPPARGGAEVRLLAGRLEAARGDSGSAERLFRASVTPDALGTAPAAELALAELLARQRRDKEAIATLEHLILTYPESALVPQARRLLDQVRGGVPQT